MVGLVAGGEVGVGVEGTEVGVSVGIEVAVDVSVGTGVGVATGVEVKVGRGVLVIISSVGSTTAPAIN